MNNKTTIKKINQGVAQTYQSQLKSDPAMELRRRIQQAGMNRRVAEARKAL